MNDATPANGDVRVTVKDVYLAQQSMKDQIAERDRQIAETLATINLTMVKVSTHIDSIDARNLAADEIHREQGRKIENLTAVVDANGLRSIRDDHTRDMRDIYSKLEALRDSQVSTDAVKKATEIAHNSRTTARQAFWGMLAALAACAGVFIALLLHIH